jgi:hypothetical protein
MEKATMVRAKCGDRKMEQVITVLVQKMEQVTVPGLAVETVQVVIKEAAENN